MRTAPAQVLRVTKTPGAIDTTFRAMMFEKSFAAITVRELCGRARINKKKV